MPNRLIGETSLYLRQHAHNPVDWYPVGPGGAQRARRTSTGPSSSASATRRATGATSWSTRASRTRRPPKVLNEHFVCIKVDREERPGPRHDLHDRPASPDPRRGRLAAVGVPHAGPARRSTPAPTSRRTTATARPGFKTLLQAIADAWQTRRDDITRQSARGRRVPATSASSLSRATGELDRSLLQNAVARAATGVRPDARRLRPRPEVPARDRTAAAPAAGSGSATTTALHMVRHTLDQMARGGMYDQLGGGFHRYSVDERWLVPHFEKMLYDNALLTVGVRRGVAGDARTRSTAGSSRRRSTTSCAR